MLLLLLQVLKHMSCTKRTLSSLLRAYKSSPPGSLVFCLFLSWTPVSLLFNDGANETDGDVCPPFRDRYWQRSQKRHTQSSGVLGITGRPLSVCVCVCFHAQSSPVETCTSMFNWLGRERRRRETQRRRLWLWSGVTCLWQHSSLQTAETCHSWWNPAGFNLTWIQTHTHTNRCCLSALLTHYEHCAPQTVCIQNQYQDATVTSLKTPSWSHELWKDSWN